MPKGLHQDRGGAAVSLRSATARLGNRSVWSDLSLDIAPGECLAVLGPNGAGKTTLLRVLLGLLPLASGTVTIDGRPPRRGSVDIGYVAQQRVFDRDLPIRGRDLVQFGVDGHRRGLPRTRGRDVDAAIAAVGATAFASSAVGMLSGGEQQRLRIAQALVGRPRLLLCDEPLLSLDIASQQGVVQLLERHRREHGTTVVFVTHEINPVIGFIDRVLYVAAGRWAAGSTNDVMTTSTLSSLYGTHVDVVRVHDRIVVVGGDVEGAAGVHHLHGSDLGTGLGGVPEDRTRAPADHEAHFQDGHGRDRPSGDRPSGDRPSGDRPSGDGPSGDRPSGDDCGDWPGAPSRGDGREIAGQPGAADAGGSDPVGG